MKDKPTIIYDMLGMDFLTVPEDMRNLVIQSHDWKTDGKQLLMQIEKAIKDVYDIYRDTNRYHADKKWGGERECLRILLTARRRVMNWTMFCLTQDTYDKFLTINDTLLDLSKKLIKKVLALYDAWLSDEEPEWRNDCEVSGTICAEAWEETETDETGSDYCSMMSIIEEIDGKNLFTLEFSGAPDIVPDHTYRWKYSATSCLLFSEGGARPFGDFTKCKAFHTLYCDTLYSHFDILRIKMFWADAAITHQRIVTPIGELL